MSEEHSGFVYTIKRPTQDADRYVACLVITPKRRGGPADVGAKVERNIGRAQAVRMAAELLRACDVPAELLAQVRAQAPPDAGDDIE